MTRKLFMVIFSILLFSACGGSEEGVAVLGLKSANSWTEESPSASTLGDIVIGPSPVAKIPADRPEKCLGQECEVCQMQLYGVAILGEVRPSSNIEKTTYRIDNLSSKDLDNIGGSYDKVNQQILYEPELLVLGFGRDWILVKVAKPFWYPGPPYANGKMRIISMSYEGYRYGRNWSCMTEELEDGDLVVIRAAGNETVPPRVVVEAYWPRSVWGNPTSLTPNYTHFSVFGDKATLTFSR